MAVPSRIYFVITLFALVVTLVSVPFTVAVLTCESREGPELTGVPCSQFTLGARVFLTLASVFTMAFTVMSWRALKAGARRDAALRKQRALEKQGEHSGQGARATPATPEAKAQETKRQADSQAPPPGYH